MEVCDVCGEGEATYQCPACRILCNDCIDEHILGEHSAEVTCPICGEEEVYWCTVCPAELYCDKHLVKHFIDFHMTGLKQGE